MKSAYELALEKMVDRGIDAPREEALDEKTRTQVAESRQKAEASLAELEILHRDRLKKLADPAAVQEEEQEYLLERARIDDKRDREIEKLRTEPD